MNERGKVLRRYGYDVGNIWHWKEAVGEELIGLIFVSKGLRSMRNSGYSFIDVYVYDADKKLYDAGWRDYLWSMTKFVNIDSVAIRL